MMFKKFCIHNREELQGEQTVLPLFQHLSRVVTSSGVIRRFSSEAPGRGPQHGWLVFRGAEGRGFAIQHQGVRSKLSSLQSSLDYVRTVSAIVKSFGGPRSFPCECTLEERPPSSWHAFEALSVLGAMWCSVSMPPPELPMKWLHTERNPMIRLSVVGVWPSSEALEVGARCACGGIQMGIPEVGIHGRGVCRGGDMTIEVYERDEVEGHNIPGVRLDLGEIEMRLSDLVGLRPGSVINLGEVNLERCFVRLGATVLAEGSFSARDGQLMLTIDSVL